MNRTGDAALMLVAVLLACGGPAQVADSAYTNGRIYIVNATQPRAEAVAIKDGEFLTVGSNAQNGFSF